jgi:hypothetical protein
MKIRPEKPSCSMQTERLTDGQTGMKDLIVTFCSFANAPKNGSFLIGGEGVDCFFGSEKGQAFDSSESGNELVFFKMRVIPSLTENAVASDE